MTRGALQVSPTLLLLADLLVLPAAARGAAGGGVSRTGRADPG